MSFLAIHPRLMTAVAGDLEGIGSAMSAGNAAAAGSATQVVPVAAEEGSALTAAQFVVQAAPYQAKATQAAAFHDRRVTDLGGNKP